MNITYTPNPLMTVVELDDADRITLRRGVESDYSDDEDNAYITRLIDACQVELRNIHCGDCICVPCSCLKCHAEEYLGINTLAGLSKHSAAKVASAFGNNGARALDQALESLASYNPTLWSNEARRQLWESCLPRWESCLPRWRAEAAAAHAWLLQYRNEHFPGTKNVKPFEPKQDFGDEQAARNMEADCTIGAGAGPGVYTREVAERLRKGKSK